MSAAIIHYRGPQIQVLSDLAPDLAPDGRGFDLASMRICFRGSLSQLMSAFPRGSSMGSMYCLGPQQPDMVRFGHIWCTIRWKGFWDDPPPNLIAWEYTSQEYHFPMEVGGEWVMHPTPTGKGSPINPATGRPWRVKRMETIGGISIQGWSITDVDDPPDLPANPATLGFPKPPGQTTLNWDSVDDPEINESVNGVGGYVLQGYRNISTEVIGSKALREWESTWVWQDKYGPGVA